MRWCTAFLPFRDHFIGSGPGFALALLTRAGGLGRRVFLRCPAFRVVCRAAGRDAHCSGLRACRSCCRRGRCSRWLGAGGRMKYRPHATHPCAAQVMRCLAHRQVSWLRFSGDWRLPGRAHATSGLLPAPPRYSGGTVPDLHRLPFSPRRRSCSACRGAPVRCFAYVYVSGHFVPPIGQGCSYVKNYPYIIFCKLTSIAGSG